MQRTLIPAVALWLAATIVRTAPARTESLPTVLVQFDQVGQVCVPEVERQRILTALGAQPIPSEAAITLVSYSDQVEMRDANWHGNAECISRGVPSFLSGHERLAVLRAYHVIELAQQMGLPAFNRPPLLAFGPQATDALSGYDPHAIRILTMRGAGTGPNYRKVEVRWASSSPSSPMNPPTQTGGNLPIASIPPPQPLSVILKETPPDLAWRRNLGWATLAFGLAGVGMGVSFLGVAGDTTGQSRAMLDPSVRLALGNQAHDYWLAGGVALGVGLGLTAAGVLVLVKNRKVEPIPSNLGHSATRVEAQQF